MIIQHVNPVHQGTAITAEMTRQVAVAAAIAAGGANVQANIRAAEATFYRSIIASCLANGLESAVFRQSLHDVAGVWA
jgi:hypothetical protein